MGSAPPGPRNQQQSFLEDKDGAAPSRTSQTCAFLRQEWPATPTWVYRRKRKERKSSTALMRYIHTYQQYYICHAFRHARVANCMHTYVLNCMFPAHQHNLQFSTSKSSHLDIQISKYKVPNTTNIANIKQIT